MDEGLPGFMVRVSPSGHRSYSLTYSKDGKVKRVTIGPIDRMSLAGAREAGRKLLADVTKGGDPAGEKALRREQETLGLGPLFRDLCDSFVQDQADDWRPSTRKGWTRYIEREIKPALGDKKPEQVTSQDVRALVDRMKHGQPAGKDNHGNPQWKRRPAPISARRCFEVIRRLCAWAVWQRRLSISPCEQARPFERRKSGKRKAARNKPYSDDQLRAIFTAKQGTEIDHLLELVARTGVRSHEALSAQWQDFDLERRLWRVPAAMHKTGDETGTPHLVPLSKAGLRLVQTIREANLAAGRGGSPWLFPASTTSCEVCVKAGHMDKPNKATATVKTAAGITGRGLLHRFRDTLKTRLSEQGTPERVSEHILGHVVPGIAGTYDHADMLPQRREALDWWNAELDRILRPKKGVGRMKAATQPRHVRSSARDHQGVPVSRE